MYNSRKGERKRKRKRERERASERGGGCAWVGACARVRLLLCLRKKCRNTYIYILCIPRTLQLSTVGPTSPSHFFVLSSSSFHALSWCCYTVRIEAGFWVVRALALFFEARVLSLLPCPLLCVHAFPLLWSVPFVLFALGRAFLRW